MSLDQYDYYLVLDLEATCCDQGTIKRHEMEIIEIGAVMVEAPTLRMLEEFQTFIKPVRHPILTEFCKSLTSITQSQVDQAPGYVEAIALLQQWLSNYPNAVFGSWGDYADKTEIPCIHAGLSADYAEVIWNEVYRVPSDVNDDVCDYPLARNLVMLTVSVACEAIASFIASGEQRNFTITLKDLTVQSLKL